MKTKMSASLFLGRVAAALVSCVVAAVAMAACTSPAEDPSGVTSANQCNSVDYHHDESKNAVGPGKCASDCDCDGLRSCISGACQGEARPTAQLPAKRQLLR